MASSSFLRPRLASWLAGGALAAAAVLGARAAGWVEPLELALYDRLAVARRAAAATPSERLLVVEITEADIREQGHWPISDDTLARAIEALLAAGARGVGLDLYRDLPVAPGVERLDALLRRDPRIVTVKKFGALDADGIAGPPALADTGRACFNDLVVDRDGLVRRGLLYVDDGTGPPETSFAARLALQLLVAEGVRVGPEPDTGWLMLGETAVPPLESSDGGYAGVDAAGYQILLDHRRASEHLAVVSLGRVLAGAVPPESVRDRIVLVGSNARSLPDLFALPGRAEVPGVHVHALVVDQLLRVGLGEQALTRPVGDALEVLLVVAMACLGAGLAVRVGGGPGAGLGTLLLAAALGGIGLYELARALLARDLWLPVAAPLLAGWGALGLATALVSALERADRAALMRIFTTRVSPGVAEDLWRQRESFLADGRIRPRRLRVTVMYIDMRGYSRRADELDPESLMHWSNAFMDTMARIVEEHGGIVDDYFGDGIKANFGVPVPRTDECEVAADARAAVRAALAMRAALVDLNERLRAEGQPAISMKIGIDSGPAVAAELGSAGRLKYTVVGAVAVTAQRLEATHAVAHDYETEPCRILLGASTRALCGDEVASRPVGPIRLKGSAEPVQVHRVLPAGTDAPEPLPASPA